MKRINYIGLLLVLCLSVASCTDESLSMPVFNTSRTDNGKERSVVTSNLVQQADGTWKANARVALVGPGRMINSVGSGLLSAIQTSDVHLEYMMDTDLTNAASFASSLATIEAGMPIVGVKDMYRTYSAGQQAGFIYRANAEDASLLKVELLQSGFWLEFYNDGEKVGSTVTTGGGNAGVLSLGLLTLPPSGTGSMELALVAECEQPFDEIRMGRSSVDVSALTTFDICYAFVGDNPEIPITTDESWFVDGKGVAVNSKYTVGVVDENSVVDADLEGTYATYADVILGVVPHYITVDAGKTIPAGYEVGFYFLDTKIADVGVLSNGTSLRTFSDNPTGTENWLEKAGGDVTVLGLSLGTGSKGKISMIAQKDFQQVMLHISSGLISIGGGNMYYAYIRQPMELDASNYFTAADEVTSQSYYNLLKPAYGEVTYTLISQPDGATASIGYTTGTQSPRLVNMNREGNYQIKATYTLDVPGLEQETQCLEHTFTITKEAPQVDCNQWITQSSQKAAVVSPVDGSAGCLLCLSAENDNVNYLTDNEPGNYATYTGVLDLATNKAIVAIHMDEMVEASETNQVRTGFVIQAANELLNVNALKFFRVRLYREGQEVTGTGVTDQNSTVNISLLGGDNGKIRYSVIATQPFDQIELWTSGVANIGLVNRLRLYGAFYESVGDCDDLDASLTDVCMESMSPLNSGLEVDYANMQMGAGLLGVGNAMDELEYLLDGDKTTAAFSNNTLSVLTQTTLAVKFNPVASGQAIGIVLKHEGGVLDAEVANDITLRLFDDEVEVASTSTNGLVDVNVISYGGYTTYEVIPGREVNRMELSLGSLLTATSNVSLSDIYLRPDSDGDGIPDCAEDEGEMNEVSLTYVGISEHVCEERNAEGKRTGNGRVRVDMFGGTVDESYSLYYYAVRGTQTRDEVYTVTVPLQEDSQGNRYFELELPVGEYYVGITDSRSVYNGAHAMVHPLQTIWLGTVSTDWNTWDNWSEGTPWGCSDVIIPSPIDSKAIASYNEIASQSIAWHRFPVLENEENFCGNIHFEPGAQVVNTLHLTYERAFVDCALQGGREYLVSAPLKDMATGDWFIGTLKNGLTESIEDTYFTLWTDDTYEVNRFAPRVYQSFWSRTVYGMKGDNSTTAITPDMAQWTAPFNAVRQRYPNGGAFKIRAGAENDTQSYTFLFPKYHNVYWYYQADGSKSSIYEDLGTANQDDDAIRTGQGGRFAYEPNSEEPTWPLSVTLTNEDESGQTFLAGNPLMASLHILKFMEGNEHVSSIKLYDGEEYISIVNSSGTLVATDGNTYTHILPMQGFLVEWKEQGSSCTLQYGEEMFEASVATSLQSRAAGKTDASILELQAIAEGKISHSLLKQSSLASDAYSNGEDTRVLMDDEQTPVSLYSLCEEGYALDIQQMKSLQRIPLGVYVNKGTSVTFRWKAGSDWEKWVLVDNLSGQHYAMSEVTEFSVFVAESTDSRFYLKLQK